MKKRLVLFLCLVLCMLTVAGCSLSLTSTNKNFKESTLKASTEEYIQKWFTTDYQSQVDQIDETVQYYDALTEQMSEDELASYMEQREEIMKTREEYAAMAKQVADYGEFKERFGKIEYTISSDSATVTENIKTSKGKKIVFSVTYDENGSVTDSKIDDYKTMMQKMGKAGLNTVMCMGIVFIVLIFIALIISLFRFIGSGKKEEPQTVAEPEVSAMMSEESANLVDDLELVAVITAAIAAASENQSADGLVIRSIIRR